ncbi:thiamine ABC transporter permease [Vibrio sp. SS-MA-C1-2]|uniref:ABC transporter permease n=1 Tax=Vibrio sp. SS-MA-C1-2 TaxID=2908646 RepID=UPI001F1E1FBD|nr:ABC transporter permease subunit [Vibrio sp. SS-MA-C1-2]UJF18598.1 thiamine ABC transporter permease [Vibrio sp. SS-MA-C1-2]
MLMIIAVICFLPLIPGVIGVIAPAIGWLPALGLNEFSFAAWETLFDWPTLSHATFLALFIAFTSTLLALTIAFLVLYFHWQKRTWRWIEQLLAPLIALPHIAFTIGLLFLLSPTGAIFRFINTIFETEVNAHWLFVQDQYGIGMIIALAMKEAFFILLVSVPVMKQLNATKLIAATTSLGYHVSACWLKIILPQWIRHIRLPIAAIATFSLSVVDMTMIIGPTHPAPLATLIWQWLNEPDLTYLPLAAAGTLFLFFIACLLLFILRALEFLLFQRQNSWLIMGRRQYPIWGRSLPVVIFSLPFISMVILFIWSFSLRWRYPDLSPSRWSTRFWQQEWSAVSELISTSLIIAIVSTSIALLCAIGCQELRHKTGKSIPTWLIALPLVMPQLALLFGFHAATLNFPSIDYIYWVIWSHIIFVFPYCYLTLQGPWQSFDLRLIHVAKSLGKSPAQAWFKVKLPLLLPAILSAFAIGVSVSLTQYLPTLLLGAGRVTTITTEAVALTSGQDRRIMAIYGLLQGGLPLLFFSVSLWVSHLIPKLSQRKSKNISTNKLITHSAH